MIGMRLDHLSFAAGPDGLASTAQRIGGLLGTEFRNGGVHPRFGTRNMVLPLAGDTYLEIVEVLDHPASDKAPFGQAVRARSLLGGGWLGWVVAVDDIAAVETRLGREAANGNRHRPDGVELTWKQIGVNGLIADPQLPFFIEWGVAPEAPPEPRRRHRLQPDQPGDRRRPAAGLALARADRRGAAGGREGRVGRPNGTPGIIAAQIQTPHGLVRVSARRSWRREAPDPSRARSGRLRDRGTRSRRACRDQTTILG